MNGKMRGKERFSENPGFPNEDYKTRTTSRPLKKGLGERRKTGPAELVRKLQVR